MLQEVTKDVYLTARSAFWLVCPNRAWVLSNSWNNTARYFYDSRTGLYFFIGASDHDPTESGDLGGVFRLPGRSKVPSVAHSVTAAALALEYKQLLLDCYANVFAVWYGAGFEVLRCERFNRNQAPLAWRVTYGMPHVFWMRKRITGSPVAGEVILL